VTRAYQSLVTRLKDQAHQGRVLDLDHHVTKKALEGLFTMVGEEEKKIRKTRSPGHGPAEAGVREVVRVRQLPDDETRTAADEAAVFL